MKRISFRKIKPYIPLLLTTLFLLIGGFAIADVGNQNRYQSGDYGGGGDFALGELIGWLIGVFVDDPGTGLLILIIVLVIYLIAKRKAKKQISNVDFINRNVNQEANNDFVIDNSENIAATIRTLDPEFSAEKFKGWAQEVFLKIQEAWTTKDWKVIRPFESEELFNQHKQQLDEYIRLKKTNVVEKIGIKKCVLTSYDIDGEKEILTLQLNAILRDYVIDDETKKVLESNPNQDWYMRYRMTFYRKAGVKTEIGKEGISITNCPNCGAPTEITSSGQCSYCGSVITNGDHSWVLSDIHSIQ